MAGRQRDLDGLLLHVILALRVGFLDRPAIVAALRSWAQAPAQPPEQSLGDLDSEAIALVRALVACHLARHGDDPTRSLSSLSDSIEALRVDLEPLATTLPELATALRRLDSWTSTVPDPAGAATRTHVAPGPSTEVDPDGEATRTHTPTGPPSGNGGSFRSQPSAAPALPARFQVLRPLARGNLGEVFVARDGELDREVALKEIRADRSQRPESRARFVLEAEITGGLEHPGIIPVYSLGRYADGRPYYAMRLVRGEALRDAIRRFHQPPTPAHDPEKRNLELRQLLRRFVDLCNAIAYAHSRRVIHRDIKPANVMLGPFGETLVVDWGLAKALGAVGVPAGTSGDGDPSEGPLRPGSGSAELSRGGAIKGTPAYMSPEQARGDDVGPPTDIYSLGATLYCLLVGSSPTAGINPAEAIGRVSRGEFRPPRQVRRDVPPPLEAICLKAMARRPEDRYDSAHALADDIERWLADEPVAAYPEPFLARLTRWERRHRTLLRAGGAALLAVALVMTAAAGLLTRAWQEAETQRVKAQDNFLAAQEAQEQEKAARELADARARKLRELVDEYLDPALDAIGFAPDPGSNRLALADANVALYRDFLRSDPDDPALPQQAARVLLRSANVRRLLGQDAPAGALYDEALALTASIPAPPDAPDDPALLAVQLLRNRAEWHASNGRLRAALADLDEAVRRLAAQVPRDEQARRTLARHEGITRLNRANRRLEVGRPADALDDARRAAALLDPLAAVRGARPLDKVLALMAENTLGVTLRDLGDRSDAAAVLSAARDRARLLYLNNSLDPHVVQTLAAVQANRATLLADDPARSADFAAAVRDAFDRRATLFNQNSNLPQYRRAMAGAFTLRARLERDRGALEAAENHARAALRLLDGTPESLRERPDFLSKRAEALAMLGQVARRRGRPDQAGALLDQAIAAYRRALALDPDRWYDRCDLQDLLLKHNRVFATAPVP